LQGWGIALLRVVTGAVFLMSGGHKLFTTGLSEVASDLGGTPALLLSGVLFTLVMFLDGAALVLGLFTRWVCIPLAMGMLADILVFHQPTGFFVDDSGFALALLRLAASVTLMMTGPGKAALDNMLLASRERRMLPHSPQGLRRRSEDPPKAKRNPFST
jgi:putative oxidoreductase